MAYIGKIKLKTTWEKAEDLIKAQIGGQSSFSFDSTKTYVIQAHGLGLVNVANVSTAPTSENDGERLANLMSAKYTPDTDKLYVRADTGNTMELSISELS